MTKERFVRPDEYYPRCKEISAAEIVQVNDHYKRADQRARRELERHAELVNMCLCPEGGRKDPQIIQQKEPWTVKNK